MKKQLDKIGLDLHHVEMKYPEIQADSILDVARFSLATMNTVVDGNFFLEDAGIEIDALQAFPGPYSSYVFQTIGNDGILKLLSAEKNRTARFVSVIGLMWQGTSYLFRGVSDGRIHTKQSGSHGFGFDPIFIPDGHEQTFAEIEMDEKTQISHRSRSLTKLIDFLSNEAD